MVGEVGRHRALRVAADADDVRVEGLRHERTEPRLKGDGVERLDRQAGEVLLQAAAAHGGDQVDDDNLRGKKSLNIEAASGIM